MADFAINGDMFGRYVRIPTDRSNAMHVYKVISRIESNAYCDTPIVCTSTPSIHNEMVPVLNVIHCGIDESKVIRVAMADCEIIPGIDAIPVKHGRWEKYARCMICSECDIGFCYYKNETDRFRCCPNCGAKMDGGAENGEAD